MFAFLQNINISKSGLQNLFKLIGGAISLYAVYNGVQNENMSFFDALLNIDKKILAIESMTVGAGILTLAVTTVSTTTGIWFWKKTIHETVHNVPLLVVSFLFLSLGLASLTVTLFI